VQHRERKSCSCPVSAPNAVGRMHSFSVGHVRQKFGKFPTSKELGLGSSSVNCFAKSKAHVMEVLCCHS